MPPEPATFARRDERFTTTHWSVVLASRQKDSPHTAEALEKLCRIYWYPLYAYARRRGYSQEDAQDATQAFFERLLAKDYLESVDPAKGKFRSFLLTAFNHFLSDLRDYDRRLKRGGGQKIISFDETAGEERYKLEPVDALTAERIYERRWAFTVLEQVLSRLQSEYEQAGKSAQFQIMKRFLQGEKGSYTDAAAQLATSEGALRVAVHRLRQRYGELFRDEIAQTVRTRDEMTEEINYLLRVLAA